MSDCDEASVGAQIDGLFRRESAHLVAALVRVLGPGSVALAEDVVQDALATAMHAWRFGLPDDPKAWLLQVARRRAIDVIRRERRGAALNGERVAEATIDRAVEHALSPAADTANQLAMMFAVCDDALSTETHVTLVLRLLCGFSPAEIARAFLGDVQTIDRRLHRGRARLAELGRIQPVDDAEALRARQPSVERALYLLFNEGYHGSDPDNPLHPAMCADAVRLAELLLEARGIARPRVHALAALFCLHAARLVTRLDDEGVFIPLAVQDRSRWDRSLLERGLVHLGESASGEEMTRWHLEAGIAFEHASAASVSDTRWDVVVRHYDGLMSAAPGPVVAMNRALALAELHGLAAGREALAALATEAKLASYAFYWAARADVERRDGRGVEAAAFYRRAIEHARSRAERVAYERRLLEVTS